MMTWWSAGGVPSLSDARGSLPAQQPLPVWRSIEREVHRAGLNLNARLCVIVHMQISRIQQEVSSVLLDEEALVGA